MRTRLFYMLLIGLLAAVSGCEKEEDPCEDLVCLNGGACQDGSCICPEGFGGANCQTTVNTMGTAVFYTTASLDYGEIDVTVNGITRSITMSSENSNSPDCNNTLNPTFELPQGEHSYTAHDSYRNWSGTVTIYAAGHCSPMLLTLQDPDIAMLTVHTPLSQNLPVSVTVTGTGIAGGSQTLNITQAYPSGITSCDVVGCANFVVLPGMYTLTATTSNGSNGSMQVNVETSCHTITVN